MKRICVPLFSRPNYGRMKSVLKAIQDHPQLELQLIVGGSLLLDNFGGIDVIKADGFEPIEEIYAVIQGDKPQCMADTVAAFTMKLTQIFARIKPDVVLVHADRYEMLSIACAASYMNIPLAHNQSGEVSGTIDDKVRNAITMLSDIHFTATERAAERVKKMGAERVYNVGCPSLDLIAGMQFDISKLAKYKGVGADIDYNESYIVVMQHPVTTEYGSGAQQIEQTIKAIQMIDTQVVWLWPNIDSGNNDITGIIRRYRERGELKNVKFIKNMSPEDYYSLINSCDCLIGNTSSGIREGNFLGVPYVCVGTRQMDREHGLNVKFAGYDFMEIADAIKHMQYRVFHKDNIYGDGRASERIVNVLLEV